MWFNISSPCFHSSGKCKPPSSVTVSVPAPATEFPFKNSFFNGSNFQVFLVHQAMECSLCRGGYRADVNTAFNYKSNPERATLHCPAALSTKARPSYSSTPHCNAGNLWPFPRIISQVRQKASQWVWVKGMWRMLRLLLCALASLLWIGCYSTLRRSGMTLTAELVSTCSSNLLLFSSIRQRHQLVFPRFLICPHWF